MKTKLYLFTAVLALLLHLCAYAQIKIPADDTLFINNVSAYFSADGMLDYNEQAGIPMYRAPKDGDVCSIFCGSLWVGGLDAGGQLHTAAATYRQNGNDFWPGPIMDSVNYSVQQDTNWDKLYRVSKSTIDSFRTGLYGNTVPQEILAWPANGNTALGEMPQLAPYVNISNSGYYNPAKGDYPSIRGDQAIYMIYNDARGASHTESGGAKFGIEVHLMAYQFMNTDTAVNQTTFLHYDIYNLSKNNYHNVYIGNWVNMAMGNYGISYVGCDSINNFWYTYSPTAIDSSGNGQYQYLHTPPSQSLVYLCDTMKHFMCYYNDFTVQGNPVNDTTYYNYLQSLWANGLHTTYGGTGYKSSATNTNYVYSGNPVTGNSWSEVTDTAPAADMRGVSSIGPVILSAATSKSLDVALVFTRNPTPGSTANLQSVALQQKYITDVKKFYNNQLYGCDQGLLGINEVANNLYNELITAYPNPSNGVFTIKSSVASHQSVVLVYNMLGEKVYNAVLNGDESVIDLSGQPTGVYLYRILTENGQFIAGGKLVVQ